MHAFRSLAILLAMCLLHLACAQQPAGTVFTYHGNLQQSGQPFNGTANLTFTLFTLDTTGTSLGTVTIPTQPISNGLFRSSLDFGASPFATNEARWLEITVNGITLSPRQRLTPTPYSIATRGIDISPAGNAAIGVAPTTAKLAVGGVIESTSGGIRFPDASVQTSSASLPPGVIVMWSGVLTAIPAGWAICDGTNGTPDLRDRFVLGTSQGMNPGPTGGSSNHDHTTPAHDHIIAARQIPLPQHSHSVPAQTVQSQGPSGFTTGVASGGTQVPNNSHTHSITIPSHTTNNSPFGQIGLSQTRTGVPPGTDESGGITNTVSHIPPYYRLTFIMKL